MQNVTRPGCPCSPLSLCPDCYRELTQRDAEATLRHWLETWGNVPTPAPERQKPRLRLVPAVAALALASIH